MTQLSTLPQTFPEADINEVSLLIAPYMDDPRNINAECRVVEQEIEFVLPPHELDPTGEGIYTTGHIDQIRYTNGMELVWDYKTGKKTGWEMIHDYAIQIAGYTFGAKHTKWPNVKPGGIIRGMGYRARAAVKPSPDGVFFACPFTVKDLMLILEAVQLEVALMRMGKPRFGPGPHCTFCEFGGLTGCLKHWHKLEESGGK